MGEVLEFEAAGTEGKIDPEKAADIQEIINYRRALVQATDLLKELPLCNRLIKAAHEALMSGVRGHDKGRGRFRTIQNYIGRPGAPVEQARFAPIAPGLLEEGMATWEKYVNDKAQIGSFNFPSFTPSSSLFTPSWTVTGGWGVCSFLCFSSRTGNCMRRCSTSAIIWKPTGRSIVIDCWQCLGTATGRGGVNFSSMH